VARPSRSSCAQHLPQQRRTFDRKIREAMLALALESKFSKDQILELYLNKVYFGGGAYGVDLAARKFFGHSGEQLRARRRSSPGSSRRLRTIRPRRMRRRP
jgi:membrane carboxypeptidase/penicillin-binding protein